MPRERIIELRDASEIPDPVLPDPPQIVVTAPVIPVSLAEALRAQGVAGAIATAERDRNYFEARTAELVQNMLDRCHESAACGDTYAFGRQLDEPWLIDNTQRPWFWQRTAKGMVTGVIVDHSVLGGPALEAWHRLRNMGLTVRVRRRVNINDKSNFSYNLEVVF